MTSAYDLSHLTGPPNQWVLGQIQDDEALFLYSMIRGKRIKTVLEVGSFEGYSAQNFLAAVGEQGAVYSVDIIKLEPLAKNHYFIHKNAKDLEAHDLNYETMELVFFDCHDYDIAMQVFHNLCEANIINDNTVLALHDTNYHYTNSTPCANWGKKLRDKDGNVLAYGHAMDEKKMANTFVELGYQAFSLHTTADKHNEQLPHRHGITILSKWKPIPVCSNPGCYGPYGACHREKCHDETV
jgi:predicted O-methyltransferase YrrM